MKLPIVGAVLLGLVIGWLAFRANWPLGVVLAVIGTVWFCSFVYQADSMHPQKCLKRRVQVADIEEQMARPEVSEQGRHRWAEFRRHMREGDEIWEFSTPPWTWKRLCGRQGYVIVRDGKPTGTVLITLMN
jgi:hypothetical protein